MGFSTDIDNLITYLSDAPTNEQLKVLTSLLPKLKLEGGNYESLTFLLNYLGSGGEASIAGVATEATLNSINTKLPSLTVSNTRLLVDTGLSSISVSNFPSSFEISNDVGNAIPVSFNSLPTGSNTIGAISNTGFSATQSGTWNVNNISGTISLPTGASTSANQVTTNNSLSSIDGKLPPLGQALASGSVPVVLTASQLSTLTPLSTITANAGTNLNTSALALETGGNLASINNKLNSQVVSSSTVTTVNASASDTTLLASNANRKGFIIFNNSTAILYILLTSGTSSSTNFSILLNQNESLIIDNTCLYTGIVKGIWASATGDCKVTEFS
jgi:hypothetical protein